VQQLKGVATTNDDGIAVFDHFFCVGWRYDIIPFPLRFGVVFLVGKA
jgi:hypothetical protein